MGVTVEWHVKMPNKPHRALPGHPARYGATHDRHHRRCREHGPWRRYFDISNPVDFTTFGSLVVPPGTSAAEQIAAAAPEAQVVKFWAAVGLAVRVSGHRHRLRSGRRGPPRHCAAARHHVALTDYTYLAVATVGIMLAFVADLSRQTFGWAFNLLDASALSVWAVARGGQKTLAVGLVALYTSQS